MYSRSQDLKGLNSPDFVVFRGLNRQISREKFSLIELLKRLENLNELQVIDLLDLELLQYFQIL